VRQATLIHHSSNSLRTQHGILCTDCNQEVAHTCSSPITSSSRYEHPPSSALTNLTGFPNYLSGPTTLGTFPFGERVTNSASTTSQVQPLLPSSSNIFWSHPTGSYPPISVMSGSPAGVQTDFADFTVQGNLFGQQVATCSVPDPFVSGMYHVQPPPPNSSDILSVFTPDPPSVPNGTTSSFPPFFPSSAVHSQAKRNLHSPDLECEPETKRTRHVQESINQQSEPNDSQCLRLPLLEDLLVNTTSTSEAVMSPSIPRSPATTSEDSVVVSKPKSRADWSVTYNTKVERELDVTMASLIEVESLNCLQLSIDGKYLAVGFENNGTTHIYDAGTGEKTWLVYYTCFSFRTLLINLWYQYIERVHLCRR
jgi:hypothetical protein